MSGVILSAAALDFWRMAVLRNRDSDVTTTDIRASPRLEIVLRRRLFMRAREIFDAWKAYGFFAALANPENF
jgi:hypothetical protein